MTQQEKLNQLLSENAIDSNAFSACLGIDETLALNLLSGKKKLSNSLARQIEQTFCKPKFWLEPEHSASGGSYDLFG
jgi:plasmid maintenance system antidote protein VapI